MDMRAGMPHASLACCVAGIITCIDCASKTALASVMTITSSVLAHTSSNTRNAFVEICAVFSISLTVILLNGDHLNDVERAQAESAITPS